MEGLDRELEAIYRVPQEVLAGRGGIPWELMGHYRHL